MLLAEASSNSTQQREKYLLGLISFHSVIMTAFKRYFESRSRNQKLLWFLLLSVSLNIMFCISVADF